MYSAYVVDVKKNCGHSTLLIATIRVCYKQSANTYLPSYLTILVLLGFLLPLSFSFFLLIYFYCVSLLVASESLQVDIFTIFCNYD